MNATTDQARLPLNENLVENPLQKETFRFRPGDSSPEALRFDFEVGPGGGMEMLHQHLHQRETFRCISGRLTVLLGDGERTLEPGQEVVIEAGQTHGFVNRGDEPVVCDVAYLPAGRNEDWLKIITAVQRVTGKEAGVLDLAPFILDVGLFIVGPPIWAQRLLFGVLRPIAKLLGRDKAALAAAATVYGRPFTW
jgi:mannose-6-phosphate isomerase-like protein (cupin superfamily)